MYSHHYVQPSHLGRSLISIYSMTVNKKFLNYLQRHDSVLLLLPSTLPTPIALSRSSQGPTVFRTPVSTIKSTFRFSTDLFLA